MTFGFTSAIDLLSWIVVVSLAAKLVATAVLLPRPAAVRLATRNGRRLWWTTKITPVIAAPCLVAIAWLADDRSALFGYSLLLLFVAVAVPLAIHRRHLGSLSSQLHAAVRGPRTPSPPSPRPR